jgi:hypothetical protein
MTQEWPLLVLVMSGASGAMKASGSPSYAAGLWSSTTGLWGMLGAWA